MKKLYLVQTISILALICCMMYGLYLEIFIFDKDVTLSHLFVYLFAYLSLFFSFKNRIYSSIIMIFYGIYGLIKFGDVLNIPIVIYRSIINGYYQFGFTELFVCLNLIIASILLIMHIDKISKEDAK